MSGTHVRVVDFLLQNIEDISEKDISRYIGDISGYIGNISK